MVQAGEGFEYYLEPGKINTTSKDSKPSFYNCKVAVSLFPSPRETCVYSAQERWLPASKDDLLQ